MARLVEYQTYITNFNKTMNTELGCLQAAYPSLFRAYSVHSRKSQSVVGRNLLGFFTPKSGGGSGIRTHDEVAPITVFEAVRL